MRAASTAVLMAVVLATGWSADVNEVPADYVLYPGDLVDVRIFDHPDLATVVRIPKQGSVEFPLIGTLSPVCGITVNDLNGEITRRLRDGFVRDPAVICTVTQFGPRQIYVMGSVTSPTAIELNPLASMTVMQAIGQAGGFLPEANRKAAHVLRTDPADQDERIAVPLPLHESGSAAAAECVLQPGDIVVIPRLDRIYVLGQVASPGAYDLSEDGNLSVSKAISLAGGFERFAKQGNVQLIRDGVRVKTIDMRKVLQGRNGGDDLVLQPGDTVFIPESRF